MKPFKKIEILQCTGDAVNTEDAFYASFPVFAVFDGVSEPYSQSRPQKLFGRDRVTGGALVVDKAIRALKRLNAKMDLSELMCRVNSAVARMQNREWNVPLHRADLLAGVTFAAIKFCGKEVQVMQAGDSFAIMIAKDGSFIVAPNAVRDCQGEFQREFRDLLRARQMQSKSRSRVWDETWDELLPKYMDMVRLSANNPDAQLWYGILNGQRYFQLCCYEETFKIKDLRAIYLMTDGFAGWDGKTEKQVAEFIISRHARTGSLDKTLELVRDCPLICSRKIKRTEATAIYIELDITK